jgi:uncharacterized membrane protein YoaK (UPF0700 family)
MPLFYLRRLTGSKRSDSANRHLARYLAFIAGASNAGGFLAVGHYTSHMSGVVAAMADDFALGSFRLVMVGLASVVSFFLGSFLTTLFVRWARGRGLTSEYAFPLMAEAALLLFFALEGGSFSGVRAVVGLIVLLCFAMGMQNAIITKISDAVIRTTHMTGIVTDIGIAVGRIVSAAVKHTEVDVAAELDTLRLLTSLVALFFVGGVAGALGFRYAGFLFALPLAGVLLLLAGVPVVDDILRRESVTV